MTHRWTRNGRWRPSSTKSVSGFTTREGFWWRASTSSTTMLWGLGDSIEASPLLRRVLLRAADKALGDPLPTHRRADIAMFHQRIRGGGLAWNADKKSVRVVAQRQCICCQDETFIHPNLGAGAALPFLNSQATGGKAMPTFVPAQAYS